MSALASGFVYTCSYLFLSAFIWKGGQRNDPKHWWPGRDGVSALRLPPEQPGNHSFFSKMRNETSGTGLNRTGSRQRKIAASLLATPICSVTASAVAGHWAPRSEWPLDQPSSLLRSLRPFRLMPYAFCASAAALVAAERKQRTDEPEPFHWPNYCSRLQQRRQRYQ